MDLEQITKAIYEATRLESLWSNRTIVPEKWEDRDEAFKKQMIDVVKHYLEMNNLPTPLIFRLERIF